MSESKTFDFGDALRAMKLGKIVTCPELGDNCLSLSGGSILFRNATATEDAWVEWGPTSELLSICLRSNKWSVEKLGVYSVRYYDRDGNFMEGEELSCSGNVRLTVSRIINLGSNKYWQASITGNGVDCLVLA